MAFTNRGKRLVESLVKLSKDKPMYYETSNFFNKVKFTAANDDHLKAVMTIDNSMCNVFGIMHGGYISLVVDMMSLYAHAAKHDGRITFTNNISINFVGLAVVGDKVTAEAKTVKVNKYSVIMESTLYKDDGTLIAKSMANFGIGNENVQRRSYDVLGFDVLKSKY